MPAEQQAEQRRLAGAGGTDDGDVFAGPDGQVDVAQDVVARRDDGAVADR